MYYQQQYSGRKTAIIIAVAFIAGVAITIVIFSLLFYLAEGNPKDWDNKTIIASFDYVTTTASDNHFLFVYTLENKSESDFEIREFSDYKIMGKLPNNIFISEMKDSIYIKTPLFIPAKQRTRLFVVLKYKYPDKEPINQDVSKEEKEAYRQEVIKYLHEHLSELNGFVIFDESHRYQIDLAKG
ncbi:MAG TPA: hypothetical protein VFG06_09660 [Thermodesulfovibrionales bacterium]|nr:hypothetical protein [Thermodesulfovibrionales bacterium]